MPLIKQSNNTHAIPYQHELLALYTANLDVDLIVAASKENIRYFTGFSPVVKILNPYGGECYAILQRGKLDSVSVVHSAGEADQLLDMTSKLRDAWIYGTFYRRHGTLRNLSSDEEKLQAFGKPVASTAIQALILAVTEYCGTRNDCRILIDEEGITTPRINEIKAALPNVTIVPGSEILRRTRRIKTPQEVSLLTQAAIQNEEAINRCLARITQGTTETSIVQYFEEELVRCGGRPEVTMAKIGRHAVTGQRRPDPMHRLEMGDVIWFDSDTSFQGYWADIARTAILGAPSQLQKDRYSALREGMVEGLAAIRPGLTGADVFDIVTGAVKKAGIVDYQRHHVGHGIGLEPYEAPILMPNESMVLKAGMVISLETPLYEYGFGALHIEDPVLVTETGAVFLTNQPNPQLKSVWESEV